MTIIRTEATTRDREPNDFYPTPPELCLAALKESRFIRSAPNILDPGCGDGPWGKMAQVLWPDAKRTGIDVRDVDPGYECFLKQDFLSTEIYVPRYSRTEYGYDLVIGNPPYKFAEEFVRKSIDLLRDGGEVIFLLRLAFLESAKRATVLYIDLPPREVFVSSRRVSFTGNRKTDDTAYAIYIWQKGHKAGTDLRWLNWDYEGKKKRSKRK